MGVEHQTASHIENPPILFHLLFSNSDKGTSMNQNGFHIPTTKVNIHQIEKVLRLRRAVEGIQESRVGNRGAYRGMFIPVYMIMMWHRSKKPHYSFECHS